MPDLISPNTLVVTLAMAGVTIEAHYNPGLADKNTHITRFVSGAPISQSDVKCSTLNEVFSQMQKKFFNG